MTEYPPYMTSYGRISKILTKIKDASRPERFTQDFLTTKLGFAGGSAMAFIPFAKRIGLLNADGTPTELYTKFRNPSESGYAIAQAIRIGYKALYERNEYAHALTADKLQGLIVETTGLAKDTTVVASIKGSFLALKQFANFEAGPLPGEPELVPKTGSQGIATLKSADQTLPGGVHLAYTINLNLPETTNVAVFNAIFKSLKEHLLQG
jgi:hypothetical protein